MNQDAGMKHTMQNRILLARSRTRGRRCRIDSKRPAGGAAAAEAVVDEEADEVDEDDDQDELEECGTVFPPKRMLRMRYQAD